MRTCSLPSIFCDFFSSILIWHCQMQRITMICINCHFVLPSSHSNWTTFGANVVQTSENKMLSNDMEAFLCQCDTIAPPMGGFFILRNYFHWNSMLSCSDSIKCLSIVSDRSEALQYTYLFLNYCFRFSLFWMRIVSEHIFPSHSIIFRVFFFRKNILASNINVNLNQKHAFT